MRTIYLHDLKTRLDKSPEVILSDIHHLINVIKVKVGDEILLMDGLGLRAQAHIQSISKKMIELKVEGQQVMDPPHNISLAQCLVKKEAMEDILRMSVEVGIAQVFPLQSQFSWHLFIPETRVKSILSNALEQSNNPHLPLIANPSKLLEFNFKVYDHVLYFTSNPDAPSKQNSLIKGKILLLIGPEGGLSKTEEEYLFSQINFSVYHLPTPILRSPTAVLVATGFTLAKLV